MVLLQKLMVRVNRGRIPVRKSAPFILRGAHRDHLTGNTTTARKKVLEKKLGMALSERHGTHLKLTKAGEVLYKGAERILAGARELEEHMKEISGRTGGSVRDRKSTRLNSSHSQISY